MNDNEFWLYLTAIICLTLVLLTWINRKKPVMKKEDPQRDRFK